MQNYFFEHDTIRNVKKIPILNLIVVFIGVHLLLFIPTLSKLFGNCSFFCATDSHFAESDTTSVFRMKKAGCIKKFNIFVLPFSNFRMNTVSNCESLGFLF